jgi:hypothetical protein
MGTMDATFANACITAGVALLNGGTAEFQTAGGTEVATVTLANPAQSGSASGGVATFSAITPDSSATGGGPITKLVLKTSGGVARAKGTVAESGAEIDIDNDSPPAGVEVSLSLTAAFPVGTVP